MSIKDFENSLKLTNIAFLISGIQINLTKYFNTKFFDWLFYFNTIWLYCDVLGEFSWLIEGIYMGKSLDELSMVAPCTNICLLATSKMLNIFFNKDVIKSAVSTLKHLYQSNLNGNMFQTQIVKESTRFLNNVIMVFAVTSVVVVISFPLMPLTLMVYEHFYFGRTELKLPFLTKYFVDSYSNKMVWSFVYFHQVWSTVVVGVNIFAADTLFYTFCAHLDMHFKILCHGFENIVCASAKETSNQLSKCIRKHLELIELAEKLEMLYSKSNLFNILSSSLLICLSGFNISLLEDSKAASFTFIPFLVVSLTQIALLCYFGDILMSSSIKIGVAIYKCRWYDAAPDVRKSVLVILLRAKKPCKVTAANFAVIHLTTFTTILSRSWSYFALLRTMYD